MKNGRSMKASLAVSVLLHSVLVGALFLIGSQPAGKREVFFVELKSISVSPSSESTRSVAPARKPNAPPPKRVVKPDKKPLEEISRLTEVNKPQVVEKIAEEAPAADAPEAPVNYVVEAPQEQLTGDTETQGPVLPSSYTGEEFAPSSGVNVSSSGPSNELLRQIRDAIQRELTYPTLARKRRVQGTVVAGFTIDFRGEPHNIEIVESSGYSLLDREVIKIIRRAAPYPYIPERIEVPVSFRLVTDR